MAVCPRHGKVDYCSSTDGRDWIRSDCAWIFIMRSMGSERTSLKVRGVVLRMWLAMTYGKKNAVDVVAMKLVHVEREDIFLRFGDGVVSVDWIHASKAIGEILLNSYPTFDLRGNEPNQLPPVDGDHASTRVWRGAAFAALTSMFCPARERLISWDLLQRSVCNTFSIHRGAEVFYTLN